MSYPWKLLSAALFSSLIVACSNEPAPSISAQPSETVKDIQTAAIETPNIESQKALEAQQALEAEHAARIAKELAEKKLSEEKFAQEQAAAARAETQAKAAADAQARADKARADKARADAQALAATKAAQAQAAKDAAARAQVERQRQIAIERQAALDAQLAANAQAAASAKAAAEAERARQLQEAQAFQAAQAQTVQQAQIIEVSSPVLQTAVAPAGPNASYNAFLSKYVSNANGINLVAYDKVTAQDRASLNAYIQTLSAIDIEALPRDQEMATWFNLYNAKTIELILENYPIKSIRKISSPWGKDRLVVNGKKMSLDDIEHGTVRRKYNEPRVHYAFNCASIGCPNIKATAWEAATLEADLAQASRDFIGSERGLSVQGGKIVASSIFKWYKKDFGGNEAGILAHMRQYATGARKAALDAANNIDKYDYDWDLNIR